MAKNPVGWFEIYVDDMDRAVKFYQDVFAIKMTTLDLPDDSPITMMAFPSDMEKHGVSGALAKVEGMPAGNNSIVIYFSCDDCANEESRVESAGGRVERSKMSIGEYGFVSIIRDSENNLIGLHSLA